MSDNLRPRPRRFVRDAVEYEIVTDKNRLVAEGDLVRWTTENGIWVEAQGSIGRTVADANARQYQVATPIRRRKERRG
jgi:hypothetical protein